MDIIKQDICISGKHAPVGLYIGEFRHPLRGFLFPAIIPNTQGALAFTHQAADMASVAHVCEDLIAHFVQSLVEHKAPEINILDKSLRNRFPNLMSLNFHRNIELYSNDEQINKYIVNLCDEIRRRSYAFTDANITDIYTYNEQHDKRSEEHYILNLINLNDYAVSIERLTTLQEILIDNYALGVLFVFYFNPTAFKRFLQQQKDDKAQALEEMVQEVLKQIPIIQVAGSDLFLDKNNDFFKQLNDFVAKNKLTIEVSQRDNSKHILNNVIQDIRSKIAEIESTQDQSFLKIEVGTTPNGKDKCYFELGAKNGAFHAFMIGMNGTGKTTLLDHIIKGIAQQFTPEEAEIYLFDYKEGVEFGRYGNPNCFLPHIKLIMIDDKNIEAIYQVLKQFQSKIAERSKLLRPLDAHSIGQYNRMVSPSERLPRCFLIIDEVQRLFGHPQYKCVEDLLTDVAKMGRAFGLHMILSTQTIRGTDNISPGLFTQFQMRIAFKVDNMDAMRIFPASRINAPASLGRYEFILNDNLGYDTNNQHILMHKPEKDWLQQVYLQYAGKNYKVPELIERQIPVEETAEESAEETAEKTTDNTSTTQTEKIVEYSSFPTHDVQGLEKLINRNKISDEVLSEVLSEVLTEIRAEASSKTSSDVSLPQNELENFEQAKQE